MERTIIQIQGEVFTLRRGKEGEPFVVIEAQNSKVLPARVDMYQSLANVAVDELRGEYTPDLTYAAGEFIVKRLGGTVVSRDTPQGEPTPLEPGVCL